MPICLIDGFDAFNLSSTTFNIKGWSSISSATVFTSVTGRDGVGKAMNIAAGGYRAYKSIALSQAYRIGCAVKLANTFTSGDIPLLGLTNVKDNVTWQCGIAITPTNRYLKLVRYTPATTIATGNISVPVGTWFYIEWYIVITDSLSTNQSYIKVDGSDYLITSSGDTKNDSDNTASMISLASGSGTAVAFDDLYVSTEAVTTSPSFIGDHKVTTIYPSGNGSISDFMGSDGNKVDNYSLIGTSPLNFSSSVTPQNVNEVDTYTFSDLSGNNPQVKAANFLLATNKADASSSFYAPVVRSGGTNYSLAACAFPDGLVVTERVALTNPATSSAWSASDINNLEAGIKRET